MVLSFFFCYQVRLVEKYDNRMADAIRSSRRIPPSIILDGDECVVDDDEYGLNSIQYIQ